MEEANIIYALSSINLVQTCYCYSTLLYIYISKLVNNPPPPPPPKKKKKNLNYLLIKYIFLVIATAANANKIFPVQFFAMVSLTHFSPRRKTYDIEMWYWAKMGSLTRKRRCYANVLLSISKIFYKKKPVNGKRSMLLIVILSFRTFNHWGNHFIISTKQVVLRF